MSAPAIKKIDAPLLYGITMVILCYNNRDYDHKVTEIYLCHSAYQAEMQMHNMFNKDGLTFSAIANCIHNALGLGYEYCPLKKTCFARSERRRYERLGIPTEHRIQRRM